MCAYLCVCRWAHTRVHAKAEDDAWWLLLLSTFLFEAECLTGWDLELTGCLDCLARKPQFLVLEYRCTPPCLALYMSAQDQNSGPHVRGTSTWLAEPSFQPPIYLPLLLLAMTIFGNNCYDGPGPHHFRTLMFMLQFWFCCRWWWGIKSCSASSLPRVHLRRHPDLHQYPHVFVANTSSLKCSAVHFRNSLLYVNISMLISVLGAGFIMVNKFLIYSNYIQIMPSLVNMGHFLLDNFF